MLPASARRCVRLPFHDFAELLREQGRRQHIEDLYNDGNVKGRSVMRHSVPSDTADLYTRRYASTNASCPRSVVSRDNFHSREGILKHAATVVAAVAAVGELAAFDLRGSPRPSRPPRPRRSARARAPRRLLARAPRRAPSRREHRSPRARALVLRSSPLGRRPPGLRRRSRRARAALLPEHC